MLTIFADTLRLALRSRLPGSPPEAWEHRFPHRRYRETEEDRLYRDWLAGRR